MKNFLKKANLIIITLLCTTLVGTKEVAAFETCEDAVAKGYTCKMVGGKPIVAAPTGSYNPGKTTDFTKTDKNSKTFKDLNIYVNTPNGPLAGSSNYKYWGYSGSTGSDGSTVYCLDANKGGATDLYASRFLGDTYNNREGDKSTNVYIHDIAVMQILTSKGNVSPTSDEYRAVSLAIRSVNQLFGLSQTNSANTKECEYAYLVNGQDKEACLQSKANDGVMTKAIVGTMRDWVANGDSSIKDSYNTIREAIPGGAFFDVNNNENTNGYTLADDGGTLVKEAQEIFKDALAKAAQAASNVTATENGEGGSATVTPTNSEALNGGVQVTSTPNGEVRSLEMKYNFKLSNFTNDKKASLTFNSLGYVDGAEGVGASAEPKITNITVNGKSICDGECSLGQNVLENLAIEGDADISVTVKFEGNSEDLKCGGQPMKFNLGYSFSDSNTSENLFPGYTGVVWYAHNDKQGKITNDQRYISVSKNEDGEGTPEAINSGLDGEVTLTDACDCTALKEACEASGSSSSSECEEFFEGCSGCDVLEVKGNFGDKEAQKQYEETCDFTCDTYFDTFECCDANNLIVSDSDDKEVKVLGPGPDNPDADSIKACFVTKVDDQKTVDKDGNSEKGYIGAPGVKDQKDNTYTSYQLAENKYCTVSCKEDYIMTMPTAKMVNAGRYFTFKAKIEGTKTCYTNTIDREQYNRDIIKAQKEMLDAYNLYRLWYQYYTEERFTAPSDDSLTTGWSCEYDCDGTCGAVEETGTYRHEWQASGTVKDWKVYDEGDIKTGTLNVKDVVHSDDSPQEYVAYDKHVAGTTKCSGKCTGTKEDGTSYSCGSNNESNDYEAENEKPTHTKEQFKNEYLKDKVEEYANALDNKRKAYEALIEMYHECTNDSWTSEMNYQPDVYYDYQESYLNKFGLIGQMDEQRGASNTDAEWFCAGKGNVDKDYENCSGASSSSREQTLKKVDYTVCYPGEDPTSSPGECKIEDRKEYYDISEANYAKKTSDVEASYKPKTLFYNVYPSGEIVINKADDNVALKNSLPVSLNTDRGIYKYTVNVNYFGEFYDENSQDNLGRYAGAPTAVIDENALVYNCAYLVNIISGDGWTCDFDDTCTDDCISNCVGPNCGEDYCENGDCIHECIGLGCIYDTNAGSSILEKSVSLNKMFPNGTNSYNWSVDKNAKASAAVSEIEGLGNGIYDTKPVFSVTMNGSSAAAVRKYNKSVLDTGGYSNHTLDCYQLGGYEEIACYSTFISDYMDGTYGGTVNDSVASESRNVGNNNSEYFSLWNGSVSDKDMIGPSYQ